MLRPCFTPSAVVSSSFISSINRPHHAALHALPQPFFEATSSLAASTSTLPTILTSVKVFDGSEITNAVVVSDKFWTELSSQLPYLLLAQLLAAFVFVVIASLVTAQGKFILDQAASDNSDNIQSTKTKSRNKAQFRRANEPPPPQLDFTKLLFCICIDIVGSANEVIPLVGELVDVIYAPIAALLLRQLFSGSNVVFLLEFTEEILPFTDVLPLATICWVVESFFSSGNLARALRIGEYAPDRMEEWGNVVDVETKVKENDIDAKNREKLQSDEKDHVKK